MVVRLPIPSLGMNRLNGISDGERFMFAPPYRELSRFAGQLATCHRSGLDLVRSLEINARVFSKPKFRRAAEDAIVRVRDGAPLSVALASAPVRWPPFFIPILEAGELTGREDESLRYLERHCQLLEGPTRAAENAWLYPVCILLAGTAVQLAIHIIFGTPRGAAGFLAASVKQYAMLALVALPFFARPCRPLVDPLKLLLPVVRDVQRDLAVNRFFCALSMLYAAAGQRVESMIECAARTVTNVAIREDFLRSAAEIRRGRGVAEAFHASTHLTSEERGTIAAGDLSGTLEHSFDRISQAAGENLQVRLQVLQTFSLRLTMYVVVLAIAFTLFGLIDAATSR